MAIQDQMKRTADAIRSGQSTMDAASMVGDKTNLTQDTGGWAYADAGDGRIKIVSSPPTSKLKPGAIIDPAKIAAMPDGPAKDRAARAYNSIRGVMMGAAPLEPIPASKKPAGGKAQPASAAPPAGGAVNTPPADQQLRVAPRTDAQGPGISPIGTPGQSNLPRPGMGPMPRTHNIIHKMEGTP